MGWHQWDKGNKSDAIAKFAAAMGNSPLLTAAAMKVRLQFTLPCCFGVTVAAVADDIIVTHHTGQNLAIGVVDGLVLCVNCRP